MSIAKTNQRPLRLASGQKHDVRTQFGALCYRIRKDQVEVLLVTSRNTGRWLIPKGWPIDGATPAQAAAREALEEAGATGRVQNVCIGIFSYLKDFRSTSDRLPCVVAVFPLKVRHLEDSYPEKGERKRKWFALRKAASKVQEPELQEIIRGFDPRLLPR